MLLHTPGFLVLLAPVVILFYAFPKARLGLLAAADAVFYGLPNPAHLVLFLAVSLVTFVGAKAMVPGGEPGTTQGGGKPGTTQGGRGKGAALLFGLALAVNAANLVFFKYALFLTRSLESALGIPLPAAGGFLVKVALPIGISFYTFGLIAYLVDVRRGLLSPVRSFARFWVFVSLFPRLVAGPIARGGDLAPQVEAVGQYRFSADDFGRGLTLLLVGLAKKTVVADTLQPFVDQLFAQGTTLGGSGAWLAAYLFAFQIYFDFSAYSDMAVGVGALLGFRLPQNFRTPYVSSSPSEFWRRWHITLSTWIRDYVYIPLGGSRRGLPRQLANLVLAMTFSGLWHGAGWTFVIWGLYHGVLAALEKAGRSALEAVEGTMKRRRLAGQAGRSGPGPATPLAWAGRALGRIVGVAVCFHLVVIGWVFFRAPDLPVALGLARAMLSPGGWNLAGLGLASAGPGAAATVAVALRLLALVPILYLLHVLEHLARRDGRVLAFWHSRVPAVVRGLAYALVIVLVMTFVQTQQNPFIYSRF